jgi:hypothetical protein
MDIGYLNSEKRQDVKCLVNINVLIYFGLLGCRKTVWVKREHLIVVSLLWYMMAKCRYTFNNNN